MNEEDSRTFYYGKNFHLSTHQRGHIFIGLILALLIPVGAGFINFYLAVFLFAYLFIGLRHAHNLMKKNDGFNRYGWKDRLGFIICMIFWPYIWAKKPIPSTT